MSKRAKKVFSVSSCAFCEIPLFSSRFHPKASLGFGVQGWGSCCGCSCFSPPRGSPLPMLLPKPPKSPRRSDPASVRRAATVPSRFLKSVWGSGFSAYRIRIPYNFVDVSGVEGLALYGLRPSGCGGGGGRIGSGFWVL